MQQLRHDFSQINNKVNWNQTRSKNDESVSTWEIGTFPNTPSVSPKTRPKNTSEATENLSCGQTGKKNYRFPAKLARFSDGLAYCIQKNMDYFLSVIFGIVILYICACGSSWMAEHLERGSVPKDRDAKAFLSSMSVGEKYRNIHESSFCETPLKIYIGKGYSFLSGCSLFPVRDFGTFLDMKQTDGNVGFAAFLFSVKNIVPGEDEVGSVLKVIDNTERGIASMLLKCFIACISLSVCFLVTHILFRGGMSRLLFGWGVNLSFLIYILSVVVLPLPGILFRSGIAVFHTVRYGFGMPEVSASPENFVIGVCCGVAILLIDLAAKYGMVVTLRGCFRLVFSILERRM